MAGAVMHSNASTRINPIAGIYHKPLEVETLGKEQKPRLLGTCVLEKDD